MILKLSGGPFYLPRRIVR